VIPDDSDVDLSHVQHFLISSVSVVTNILTNLFRNFKWKITVQSNSTELSVFVHYNRDIFITEKINVVK
jgi:hypothetical protein